MMEAKIAPWKTHVVADVVELLKTPGTIAIIDTAGVPADLFLGMRAKLREDLTLKIMKKTLIRLAWKEAGLDISLIEEALDTSIQPAIVHSTTLSAFTLFSSLDETRDGRAAKPGDVAPKDIIVEAQDTGMPPGPIVGELNSIGIPAKIMKGSVHISKKVTAIEEGDVFDGDLGMMLDKLGIRPIEIGLILKGALDEGVWFLPSTLDIDRDQVRNEIIGAVASAFNLACNMSWASSLTTPTLVSLAAQRALSLAVETGWMSATSAPHLLAQAQARMLSLAASLDSSALDDELGSLLGAVTTAAANSAEVSDNAEPANTEEEEAEEEEEEETAFGGLGDLFG